MNLEFSAEALTIEGTDDVPHRLLAASGPYKLAMVLTRRREHESLGVVYFCYGRGQSFPIWHTHECAQKASYTMEAVNDKALALGPIYREADGSWLPLAGIPASWFDVTLEVTQQTGEKLVWSVTWKIYGGPILHEFLSLSHSGLEYHCAMQWTIPGLRLQMPVPLKTQEWLVVPHLQKGDLRLSTPHWELLVQSQESDGSWLLEPIATSLPAGEYLRASLYAPQAISYKIYLQATGATA